MSKRWFGLGMVLFLVALAVVIGLRLDTEAMAVVVGVIFGVAASIPTSLIVVAITWRREQKATGYGNGAGRQTAQGGLPPSVVIVNPGGATQGYPYRQPAYLPQPDGQWDAPPRQFRVIGEPDQVPIDEDRFF
ncbi:MAG: hypothetical protein ACOYZ7_15605 [Chloroflexota bacterium]